MSKAKLTTCKACGQEISAVGKKVTCPSCGHVHKKPFYKRAWFIILMVVIVLGTIGNIGRDSSTTTTDATPQSGNDQSKVEEVAANLIYGGVYKVGTDIQPGLYKVKVTEDNIMNMAYIDRAKDATMSFNSIIANIIIMNSGYVRIKDTDAYVKIQGCVLSDEESITTDIKTELEEGIHLVGIDMEPGTYRVDITDEIMNTGYVERLSDVSMDFKDIIANQLFQNQGYVEILESDYAVRLQGAKLTKAE